MTREYSTHKVALSCHRKFIVFQSCDLSPGGKYFAYVSCAGVKIGGPQGVPFLPSSSAAGPDGNHFDYLGRCDSRGRSVLM